MQHVPVSVGDSTDRSPLDARVAWIPPSPRQGRLARVASQRQRPRRQRHAQAADRINMQEDKHASQLVGRVPA